MSRIVWMIAALGVGASLGACQRQAVGPAQTASASAPAAELAEEPLEHIEASSAPAAELDSPASPRPAGLPTSALSARPPTPQLEGLAIFASATHIPLEVRARRGLRVVHDPVRARAELTFQVAPSDRERAWMGHFLSSSRSVMRAQWRGPRRLVLRLEASSDRIELVGSAREPMLVIGRLRAAGFLPRVLSSKLCADLAAVYSSSPVGPALEAACQGDSGALEQLSQGPLEDRERVLVGAFQGLDLGEAGASAGEPPFEGPGASGLELAWMLRALFVGQPHRALQATSLERAVSCDGEPSIHCELHRRLLQGAWEQAALHALEGSAPAGPALVALHERYGWAAPSELSEPLALELAARLRVASAHELAVTYYLKLLRGAEPSRTPALLTHLEQTYREQGDTFRARATRSHREEVFGASGG